MNCPSDSELFDMVVGKLEPQRFEVLCSHLEHCTDCQNRVAGMEEPEDSFIQSLGSAIGSKGPNIESSAEYKGVHDVSPADSQLLTIPCEIRNYRIDRFLGMGGMGEVYEGEHIHFQRPIALKLIQRVKQADPAFQKQFLDEISCLGRLQHPNLVVAYDAWQEEDRLFLVMEFIDGCSLSEWLRKHKPTLAFAVFVIKQLMQGVDYLHTKNFMHRDLKPSNVMIGRDEQVKIIDLGLARSLDKVSDNREMVAGTRKYMAPEQLQGENLDHRVDIFAIGQILKQLLTYVDRTPLNSVQSWLLDELLRIADKMSAELPSDRYDSVAEPLRKITHAERIATNRLRWHRMRWIPALALILVTGACLAFAMWPKISPPALAILSVTNSNPDDEMVMIDRHGQRTLVFLGRKEPLTVEPGAYEIELVFPNNRRLVPERLELREGESRIVAIERVPTTEITGTQWRKSLVYPIKMELVTVPAGKFVMGGVENDRDAKPYEFPTRNIQIEKPFQIGIFEVTVGQFAEFVDATGYRTFAESSGQGGWIANRQSSWGELRTDLSWYSPGYPLSKDYPVTVVTYEDCLAFCAWLSQRDHKEYRLPTEIEWEYACRAGAEGIFPFPEGARDQYTWNLFNTKASLGPRIVGSRSPNPWGIYDTIGNVREWCLDYFSASTYELAAEKHPQGTSEGTLRSVRGGAFMDTDPFLRSSFRGYLEPQKVVNNQGFRVVCPQ